MADIKFYDLVGQAQEVAIVRDVTPNKDNKGFNVRVKVKFVSVVNPESQEDVGSVNIVGKFFSTLAEAKQYVDTFTPGVIENIYTSEQGNMGYERERRMTGAKAVFATGKVTKEYATALNESRKALAVASATARATALAGAMGGPF